MILTINELVHFLKHPVLLKDENKSFMYRLRTLIHLVFIAIGTTFTITILIGIIEATGLLNIGKHAVEELFTSKSTLHIIALAVCIVPALEELLFRAPLLLFKNNNYFPIAFYTIAILFGYVHLSNYELTPSVLLWSPLLIAPQAFVGLYLGFIRVKFGLLWSIALHACYNGFLVSLYLLAKDAIT